MQATQRTTHTLDAPGAATYDVRPATTGDDIPLFLIGSPMGAAGFGTLASHFPDRTIITYDPRGAERSTKEDPSSQSNADQHADDLHRIIQEVGGPVDLFASSGGAVNALALVAKHPEDVRTSSRTSRRLPRSCPIARTPRRRCARSTTPTGRRLRCRHGALHRSHQPSRAVPGRLREQPAPDPAMFGMPTEDDGSRTDVLLAQNIIGSTHVRARLRRAARRLHPDHRRRGGRIGGRDGKSRGPCGR